MSEDKIKEDRIKEDRIKEEMLTLEKQIEEHRKSYYINNETKISDYDFDQLLKRLEELETQSPEKKSIFSPTKAVGSDLEEIHNLEKEGAHKEKHSKEREDNLPNRHEHSTQVLSLANTYFYRRNRLMAKEMSEKTSSL